MVVASGGLSHFVVDEELDQIVLGAMRANDGEALRRIDPRRLNSGTSEVRNWIAASAARIPIARFVGRVHPCLA